MKEQYKITIVGMGYVGLSNAVLLAQNHEVTVVDIIGQKVAMLNQKISPIPDKEIQDYLENKPLNLRATQKEEFEDADFIIIATPTNYDNKTRRFDTSDIEKIVENVLKVNKKSVIVIKSTVPPGFTETVSEKFKAPNIIFNPEFLREGKSLYDNLYPSRIVIGVMKNNQHLEKMAHIWGKLLMDGALKHDVNVMYTNPTEAEAIKLFSNTYLAMRVCFFNELDTYAESKGLDTRQIIEGICYDPRIGNYYNNPSFGYGGYCLPKDTKQVISDFEKIPNHIIKAIDRSNETRKRFIAKRIIEKTGHTCCVGIYRLSMKTDSDNYRNSSVHEIIKYLKNKNVTIIIYDPLIQEMKFEGNKVEKNLEVFKISADIIIANRMYDELLDIKEKVYTRDIYSRD